MNAKELMLLSLLCFCSGAYAEDAPALASLHFFPEPISSNPESVDSASSETRAAAAGAEAPSKDAETEDGGHDPLARPPAEIRERIERRLESLAGDLTAEGLQSSELIDELASLATLYQELDEHYAAVGALYWAFEVSRRHNGLYSLAHVPLLEQMIRSTSALGDAGEAAALGERLVELAYRNFNDPRVTSILAASADRQLRETYRLLEERSGPEIAFGVGIPGVSSTAGALPRTTRREALSSLWKARQQYHAAIAAAVQNGSHAPTDLLELEEQVLETFFLEMSHPDLAPSQETGRWLCASGEAVLETRVNNVSTFQTPTAAASALVKLADWRLLCSKNGRALDTYQSAYATLPDEEAASVTIEDLLSPQVPAALPDFYHGSLTGEPPERYRGYVDVSFVIGKYGTTRNIEILDQSAGTTKAIEKELKAYIAGNRFRPRLVDGKPARSDRVTVRYWYDY